MQVLIIILSILISDSILDFMQELPEHDVDYKKNFTKIKIYLEYGSRGDK